MYPKFREHIGILCDDRGYMIPTWISDLHAHTVDERGRTVGIIVSDILEEAVVYDHVLVIMTKTIPKKSMRYLENVSYQLMELWRIAACPTRHMWVPKHTRISREEAVRLTGLENVDALSCLPRLMTTDSICQWMGFEEGDVIHVVRTGEAFGIRIVRDK